MHHSPHGQRDVHGCLVLKAANEFVQTAETPALEGIHLQRCRDALKKKDCVLSLSPSVSLSLEGLISTRTPPHHLLVCAWRCRPAALEVACLGGVHREESLALAFFTVKSLLLAQRQQGVSVGGCLDSPPHNPGAVRETCNDLRTLRLPDTFLRLSQRRKRLSRAAPRDVQTEDVVFKGEALQKLKSLRAAQRRLAGERRYLAADSLLPKRVFSLCRERGSQARGSHHGTGEAETHSQRVDFHGAIKRGSDYQDFAESLLSRHERAGRHQR